MKTTIAFLSLISLNIFANILIKTGMGQVGEGASQMTALINGRVIFGIASFGAAAIIYIWLLRLMPLYLVQSFGAAQFIAMILSAKYILGENILPGQWVGILLIAVGIIFVGWYSK